MTGKELEKIYNEGYRAVYWTAMSLLKNEADAEDVVQDTFVSFIESYGDIEDTGKAVALLKKIAANKCLDRIKLARTDAATDEFFEDIEALPEDFLPDSIVESEETRKIVMNIIEKSLSDDVRRTLILFYFDEMSTKEIAEALGIPQGTVLWRLNFAKKKIKKEDEKYEEENDTKLYGMAIPFLSKLFIKEAEQVPFKAMSASLSALSASSEAPASGAAPKVALEAAKKGTGIMINKGLIIGIAATVVVVGAAAGITLGVLAKKADKKPSKRDKTKIEETEDDIRYTDDDYVIDEPLDDTTETTDETKTTQKITEKSIFMVMNDMTAQEIVDNIWKTGDVYVGMTKDEYASNLVVPEDTTYFKTLDDQMYWQCHYDADKCQAYVGQFAVALQMDRDTMTVKGINEMSCVELMMHIKDEEFAKEVYEKFLAKYQAEGYTVRSDTEFNGNRVVEFEGNGVSFKATFMPMLGYTIKVIVPIRSE